MTFRSGRHFLQIPGPTHVPDRVLRAMDRPTIDHRGPEFAQLGHQVLEGVRSIFGTREPVLIYPSSGTGASEAALVNTLSAGDRVLVIQNGFFAANLAGIARNLRLDVIEIECDWRRGVSTGAVTSALQRDRQFLIQAVILVHNETSTGVLTPVDEVRRQIDEAGHPCLLIVDAISSLGSAPYSHDEWGADVTIASSQKGLMLPPGLGLNAVSPKALQAHRNSRLPKSFWDWDPMIEANRSGFFPYTPATNLLYGLMEALAMFEEEGLDKVWDRHERLAHATRRAVSAWGLEPYCACETRYSPTLTTVALPEAFDADELRGLILSRFDLSLGTGLGKLSKRAFRIGHLGSMNELMLSGALCGVEMGLAAFGVPIKRGGVQAALEFLESNSSDEP